MDNTNLSSVVKSCFLNKEHVRECREKLLFASASLGARLQKGELDPNEQECLVYFFRVYDLLKKLEPFYPDE